MFQVTDVRLRDVEAQWGRTLNRFRGPVPRGLGLAQIVAESNNNPDPTVRTPQRKLGLTGIPFLQGRQLSYTETQMREGETSIYLWSIIFNQNGLLLHATYPKLWAQPTYDFWLSVRLLFTLSLATYQLLLAEVQATGAAKGTTNITLDIQTWINTVMAPTKRVGQYDQRALRTLSAELDTFRRAMERFDGPDAPSPSFGIAPTLTPGGNRRANTVIRI